MSRPDLGRRGNYGVLFRNGTMDFLAGWLLGCSQLGGLSPGALLHTFAQIRDGDPGSWTDAFAQSADAARTRAYAATDTNVAAHEWLACCVATKAALALTDPVTSVAGDRRAALAEAFTAFLDIAGIPLEPWAIPFVGAALPGYVSMDLADARTVVLVIGGGDTSAVDLWFLGGQAFLEAGYAVALVDLPGQGPTPASGLHFGPATLDAFRVILDTIRARGFVGDVVLCGWSGGGYFTVKFAETARPEDRIVALIASTPVHDIAGMFAHVMPGLVRRAPSGVLAGAVALAGRLNRVLGASVAKYDWQFGPLGISGALDAYAAMARVDLGRLEVPVLALVGAGEDAEAARQAASVVGAVQGRHPASKVVTFDAMSGGSAHCQVGNLVLALSVATSWLDGVASAS